MFGRSITRRVVNASVAVLSLYTLAVLAAGTALLVTQPGVDALSVMFETVSALSTVGLSRGVTLEFDAVVRIDTPGEADYYRNGGIMQYVLRSLIRK